MPEVLPENDLQAADAAVTHARWVREHHRRRTDKGNAQRGEDIEIALQRLHEAMTPLRKMIGQFPYGPQTDNAEQNREVIRAASAAIQRERRKLWKMKRRSASE